MKTTNEKINALNQTLSAIVFPSTIAVDSIVNLISLRSEVATSVAHFQTASQALFDSYGLKPDVNGRVIFTGHEKADEIIAKWAELLALENTFQAQLTEENLYAKIAAGLSLQQVELLKEVFSS